jgi:hypothetical protein
MTKNAKLYQAALHLYKAATHLTEIDMVKKNFILDLAKDFLNQVEISEETEIDCKEIEEYAKEIRGVE